MNSQILISIKNLEKVLSLGRTRRHTSGGMKMFIDKVTECQATTGAFLRFNLLIVIEEEAMPLYSAGLGFRFMSGKILPPMVRYGAKYYPTYYCNADLATGLGRALASKLQSLGLAEKYPFNPKPEKVIEKLLMGAAAASYFPSLPLAEIDKTEDADTEGVISLEDEEAGNFPDGHVYSQAYMKKYCTSPVK